MGLKENRRLKKADKPSGKKKKCDGEGLMYFEKQQSNLANKQKLAKNEKEMTGQVEEPVKKEKENCAL